MSKELEIIKVSSEKDEKLFLNLVDLIYRDDKNYIRPLNADISNLCFNKPHVSNWIALYDDVCVGRISAFYNEDYAETFTEKTGGIGFYECIDEHSISNQLIAEAIDWLKRTYSVEAINGPINNEINFRYWGLLIAQYNAPFFSQPYNPDYYRTHLEMFGFKSYYEQYFYESTSFTIKPVWNKIAERINTNSNYRISNLTVSELKKAPEYFLEVYNTAWSEFPNFKAIRLSEVQTIFNELKPIIDPKIISFVFFKNKPIAMLGLLPDLNLILRHIGDGELGLLGKLKFMYHKKKGTMNKAMGFIYGVAPEHQKKGINALLAVHMSDTLKKSSYKHMQMAWIGSFNPKMVRFVEKLSVRKYNTGAVYRLLLDASLPFIPKEDIL